MRARISVLLLTVAGCFLLASPARATDYAYGYTSISVDSTVVRGYHRTEVDYNTDVYYRPYVCASLYKNGTEVVRACGGGFASATRNTQTPYVSGSSYSALSDHYVNIEYEEEDPYNPGYYYYPDYLGYFFSGGGSHPIDWYYVASGIYNQRPDESIHLGDTTAAAAGPPHHFKVVDDRFFQRECGQIERQITYRVVDSQGRGAGGTYLQEIFPGSITDSCSGQNVAPSPCNLATGPFSSNFTDVIRTGCPTQAGACGFTINPNRWAWCSGSGGALATLNYNARWSFVAIDSNTSAWPAGTQFYP
jgi:hypothetical protein